MKGISETAIRFLIGIVISVIIGFGFWWFFIHNETDRIVEQNFKKFYDALDSACQIRASKDNPYSVYIEIPQKTYKTNFDEVIDRLGQTIFKDKALSFVQKFGDPYYNFHWEKFPPEPPYTLGQGVGGTLMAFFFPWSEDLPWSTNLLMTMAFKTFALGVDVLDVAQASKTVKNAIDNAARKLADRANEIIDKINDLSNGKLVSFVKKIGDIEDKFEMVYDAAKNKIRITSEIVKKAGKEAIFMGKVATMYTLFCWFTQDKSLGECLREGVIFSVFVDAGKILIKRYALPRIEVKIKEAVHKATYNMKKYLGITENKIKALFEEFSEEIKAWKSDALERLGLESPASEEFIDNIIKETNDLKDETSKIYERIKNAKNVEELRSAMENFKKLKDRISNLEKAFSSLPDKPEYSSLYFFARMDLDEAKSVIDNIIEMAEKNPENFFKNFAGVYSSEVIKEMLEELAKGYDNVFSDSLKFKKFTDNVNELPENVKKALEKHGIIKDNKFTDKVLVLSPEKNEEAFKNFEQLSVLYKGEKGFEEELAKRGFKLVYDENGNLVAVVYYKEKNTIATKIGNMFKNFYEKVFAENLHNEIIEPETAKNFLEITYEDLEKKAQTEPEKLETIVKRLGFENKEQLFTTIKRTINKIERGEIIGIAIEENTGLAELLKNLEANKKMDPKELSHILREYFFDNIVEGKNPTEIKNLGNLLRGKEFRIREDLAMWLRRGAIGYCVLRAIDIFTPLGATWWDRYFSYYGYEGQKIPYGCQTMCEQGKICVQLGACVRQFDLPKSCKDLNVEEIKLDRPSIIAPNPRFYLVSPCYGNAKIYIDSSQKTIFVSVDLDKNKQPNYCYATTGYVNTYFGMLVGRLVANAILTFFTGGAWGAIKAAETAGKATKAAIGALGAICFGAAGGKLGVGLDLVDIAVALITDIGMAWPTVYQNMPFLASWS